MPAILDSQDTATGRFGKGPWIVADQNVMFALAAAWALGLLAVALTAVPSLLSVWLVLRTGSLLLPVVLHNFGNTIMDLL